MVMLCTCLLAALIADHARAAADTTYSFEIPATTLARALPLIAEQSGVVVGMPGRLPRVRTQAVTGTLAVPQALAMLLEGTGLEAERLGASTYRLRRVEGAAAPAAAPARSAHLVELEEVIVTGVKRGQELATTPVSIQVIPGDALADLMAPDGSVTAELLDVSTSSTNLGPGRDRQFIRGVADSAFLGPSQATVSVQFDEVRATYDGPDPDLRLLDIEQIEVLKGPQGPLYGTGALGGVYRILPRRPDLWGSDFRLAMHTTSVARGDATAGFDAMWNLPLLPGRLALRGVAWDATEPGWIDNEAGRRDANDTDVRGARLALGAALTEHWSLDLQGITQLMRTADSQYLLAPGDSLSRSGVMPEPRDNDFTLGAATVRGRLFGMDAVATVSHVRQEVDGEQDASAAAANWGESAPLLFREQRRYQLWNQEARLSGRLRERVTWLAGVSGLSSDSMIRGTIEPDGDFPQEVFSLQQTVRERALFAEVSVALKSRWRLTQGLRLASTRAESEAAGEGESDERESTLKSALPSFSIDWTSGDGRRFHYLRFARAIRPGGLNPDESGDNSSFRSDKLANVDLGTRWRSAGDAVVVQSALFYTDWRHVQSDFLKSDGLIGTRNAGNGTNFGAEFNLGWSPGALWSLQLAGTLQHARLTQALVPTGEDPRLPVVPDVRFHGAVVRFFPFGEWRGAVRGAVDYIGSTRLSFEQALDLPTRAYAVAGAGVDLGRGNLAFALRVTNLLDSRADTYSYGNPFLVGSTDQHTPLRPRTVSLSVAWSKRP